MKLHAIEPTPALIAPAADPLLISKPAAQKGWQEYKDMIEAIVFYGLLGFGVVFPVFGVIYGSFFQ
ncbi:MAG: hypothetical protein R3174_01395 [Gammaproteobacteria bacterium]|nr:hypothetical protein [Gammaproteobacteria bacterium]